MLVIVAGVALAGCTDDGGQETTDPGDENGSDEAPSGEDGADDGSGDDGSGDDASDGDDGDSLPETQLDTPDAWPLRGLDTANTASFGSSGGGSGDEVWSTGTIEGASAPAIANGLVYVTMGPEVVALNPDSGERAWSTDLGEHTTGGPVVDEGTLYVGIEIDFDEGALVALDAGTGEERWSSEVNAWPSRPAVADGRVVFGHELGSAPPVVALDAETGEELWTFESEQKVPRGVTLTDEHAFLLDRSGIVYALDAASGDEVWQASGPENGVAAPTPAVSDGKVFVAYSSTLAALDIETGDGLWNHEIERFFGNSAPAVAGGLVFAGDAGGGMNEGTLYAVDAETGEEAWTFDTGAATRSSPAVNDEQVFVSVMTSNSEATVFAVDVSSGEETWSATLEGTPSPRAPAFVDGVLFASSGNVYALDA